MSEISLKHRYPGAQPFEKEHKDLFFGREKAIADLYRKVKLDQVVVLFSKSGLGKSSLLNAGIIPAAEAEGKYKPMRIRFGAWTQDATNNPVELALSQIAPKKSANTFLDKLIHDEPTLWHEIKEFQITRHDKKEAVGLLLIFDQFEELFTYPPDQVTEFKKQLAEALIANLPQRYADVLEQHFDQEQNVLDPEELDLLQVQPDVKVVFAIRSDRMSLLNGLSDYLPNILKKCFELVALDNTEARRAIVEPARKELDKLLTPPFKYTPEALDKILGFLSKNGTERIESFQLQILCQSVEDKVEKEGQLIEDSDLGDVESLYENYYDNQLERLDDEHERLTVRALIEDGLIFSAEERRLSLFEGVIWKEYGVSRETLRKLVDCHLLRAEPSMQGGGYTYELSHDTLVKPVLRSRARRREAQREQFAAIYEEQIAKLEPAEQLPVRKLIEEAMVLDVDERRIPLFEAQITNRAGIGKETLRRLLNLGLLHGDHHPQGGFQYQICSDDLVPGILAAKQKRLEQEARDADELARQEQERQMNELREKAEEEERKRLEAERLQQEAVDARQQAETERERAQKAQQEAEAQRKQAEIQKENAEKALASKRRANMFTVASLVLLGAAIILGVLVRQNALKEKYALQEKLNAQFQVDRIRVETYIEAAGTLSERYPGSALQYYQKADSIMIRYLDSEELQAEATAVLRQLDSLKHTLPLDPSSKN